MAGAHGSRTHRATPNAAPLVLKTRPGTGPNALPRAMVRPGRAGPRSARAQVRGQERSPGCAGLRAAHRVIGGIELEADIAPRCPGELAAPELRDVEIVPAELQQQLGLGRRDQPDGVVRLERGPIGNLLRLDRPERPEPVGPAGHAGAEDGGADPRSPG